MKILNVSEAKQIAKDIAKKISPPDNRDFFLVHSKKVGKVAQLIGQKIWIDSDVFIIAGWIHDIGYSKNLENHPDFAIPILHELWYDIDDTLKDCIVNHGNKKIPHTPEGKIFQLADKLSIFDYEIIEVILKHSTFPLKNDDIDFLKRMSENCFKLLENYSI